VGLTERFDESLLLLADRAGLRHLGYSTLAANNKPQHPTKAKALLKALLTKLNTSLGEPFTPGATAGSAEKGARAMASGEALGWGATEWEAHLAREADSRWGEPALQAMADFNELSMAYVERRREKADCNFYPCAPQLVAAKGLWSRKLCPAKDGDIGSPLALMRNMLNRTAGDRVVHAYVLHRLRTQLAEAGSNGRSLSERLFQLKQDCTEMAARRLEAVGPYNKKLCGVRLCDKNARRSCVSCPADPVPALESCWPSWEDQFSPDEQKWWCKRSWTIPGYDAAEMKARNFPKIQPPAFVEIPCWQTCWEAMKNSADACLRRDAPDPKTGMSGLSCKSEVHCSPRCSSPVYPSLPAFWDHWSAERMKLLGGKDFPLLNLTGPTGFGG